MGLLDFIKKEVGAALGSDDMKALKHWQDKLEEARRKYATDLADMDRREGLYAGTRKVLPGANAKAKTTKDASNIRNIVFELIESQVDSNIPTPKVSPLHADGEENARAVENIIRTDLDRLPMEVMNDEQERTCPVQGGSIWLVEWDNSMRTHTTVGDPTITLLHPKQVIPQPGVTSLQKSDYVFVQLAQTKEYIKRRFGVDVDGEEETNPEVGRVVNSDGTDRVETKVTQNIVFFRNQDGGIGKFSWVNDVPLEYYENYQARYLDVCSKCGLPRQGDAKECACGGKKWVNKAQDYEVLPHDIPLPDGTVIPAMSPVMKDGQPVLDALGNPVLEPTRIPYYVPNMYPLVVRKNVSVFGKFLGDSDVDKIQDQQEFVKKLGTKIEEKLLKGGSAVTLPKGASFKKTDEEFKVIEIKSANEAAAIQTITLQPNISYDSAEKEKAYYEAKSTLGITDAYQGKPDVTATSGVAKQISASQSAGRLESKRRMKDASYADLFQLIFLFRLAYADEPRNYMVYNSQGKREYGVFNRYAFLRQDDAGEWFYDDAYTFAVDSTGSLANNREGMWQETRMNFQTGAYGQPADPRTLLLFWRNMERLHYPGASDTVVQVEEMVAQQKAMQQMQMQLLMAGGGGPGNKTPNGAPAPQAAMSVGVGGGSGAVG